MTDIPGGFSPQAAAHPWRTGAIFAAFFLVAWFGENAWNHSLDGKATVIGLIGAPLIVLVVRLMAAVNRAWRGVDGP